MAAPMKPRKPGSLKEVCAILVAQCGGQKAVAAIWARHGWKCSPQNVARMTDSDSAQHPPRLDQIMVLEALCGEPIVTRFMADAAAHVLEPVSSAAPVPLSFALGSITKEMGELVSAAAVAIEQGRLTAAQAAIVLRETDGVYPGLGQIRAACRDALTRGTA